MSAQGKLYADILRAEVAGEDLQEDDQGNIEVCAMAGADGDGLRVGDLYVLGTISSSLVFQNPEAAHYAISRIKFGQRGR